MKRCPTCGQNYDDTQSFCANDGTRLTSEEPASSYDPLATMIATPPPSTGDINPPQTYADPTPREAPQASWMTPSEPTPAPGAWSPPPPPGAYGMAQQQNNSLAIASLVCGILSFICLGPLLGIPAIIMGFMQLSRIKSDPAGYGGKGLAIGGMVAGGLNLLLVILYILFLVIVGFSGNF